jgi:hypothetical protein
VHGPAKEGTAAVNHRHKAVPKRNINLQIRFGIFSPLLDCVELQPTSPGAGNPSIAFINTISGPVLTYQNALLKAANFEGISHT